MDSDSGLPNVKVMLALAGLLTLGIVFNVIAGAVWNNWWPLIVVVFYFLAPVPNFICSRCGLNDPMDISGRNFKDMGYFLTAAFIIGGFGCPAVLAHNDVINGAQLGLTIAGGVIVYVTILLYIHLFHAKKESF
eukprot:TRINITY_DN483_c0_g1_i1.p1 TRINITY_DN483_c0_g1~~TRINITY_DN483_c0_g1_i1.p1  ORF type:complete len:156 (+),score=29.70 TRINITY_DN483_c0_g1_i1:67-468(+)